MKKKIIAGILCGAMCASMMTACAGNQSTPEASQSSEVNAEKMHKLYIRAPKDITEMTATFINSTGGKSADVKKESAG